ncbi:hypothetical protein E2986_11442 [Frieseomelitta varia]|uniref:Uncharacterized protein n=1 Tax=Frieseomelitta varia TaxID=561572 RepID=A0A833S071_9HYME|nr:hypothetical protein E2986_11442 [Frieseomelitta varia]
MKCFMRQEDISVVDDNFCVIHEPVLKLFSYNFTSLTSTKYISNNEFFNATIRLQLCSPLKEKCNGKDGYAVCLTKNKEEKGIGSNFMKNASKGEYKKWDDNVCIHR